MWFIIADAVLIGFFLGWLVGKHVERYLAIEEGTLSASHNIPVTEIADSIQRALELNDSNTFAIDKDVIAGLLRQLRNR